MAIRILPSSSGLRSTRQFRRSTTSLCLLGALLLASVSYSQAQSVTATVTVGPCPNAIAIDPTTDTTYVTSVVNANCSGNDTVTVINGSTNATNTISSDGSTTLLNPLAISVNPTTDLVYVSDDDSTDGSITLINGTTNAASEIAPHSGAAVPSGIVVNPVTDTIYVMNLEDGGSLANGVVTVINGSTGAVTATIPVGSTPTQIAINTVTNKIYVLNLGDNTVTVIDGATNDFSTVSIAGTVTGVNLASLPVSLAINSTANKIYVGGAFESVSTTTLAESFQILVIDGATNAVSTVTVSSSSLGGSPYPAEYLAVDATTNMVYGTTGSDPDAGEVLAYNAATGATTWINAGTTPTALAIDEGTDTIYAVNQGSNDVTVINGATSGTTTVNVGAYPTAVAVNTTTHAAYVTNTNDGTVSVIGGASTAAATTTTLTSDANPATLGTSVTFTAYVEETSGTTIPTGNVTFLVDGSSVSTTALDSTGHATYSTSSLTAGTHTVVVTYAGASGFATSSSSTLTETISPPVASSPAFSPAAGTYTSAQTVTISDATTGAAIYYTTNGSTPTTSSPMYSGPITVNASETIKAIATASGYSNSAVASANYTISPTNISISIDPSSGVVYNQTVMLTASTSQTVQLGRWWITEDGLNCTTNGIACGAAPNISGGGFVTTTSPLSAGKHTFYANYSATPPPSNQLPASGIGEAIISVSQATPTITWATPAAITQGSPLSAIQLDATASIAGTFAYNPPNGTILNSGQQKLSVTFTPTDTTDYTSATATVTLTVDPAAPGASVSPASLSFPAQNTGSTSAAQSVTLTNSGSAALSIASIAASGDFAETNTCGTSVAAAASCAISVTFTPTEGGTRTGALTITDNASGSPQAVSLTGTGSTVTESTSPSSLTISSAGGSVTDTIQISSAGGFSGTVNLSCSVAYTGSGTATDAPTCSLNPTQAQVSSSSTASTTLTVSTTASSSARLNNPFLPWGGGALAAVLIFIGVPRRRWRGLTLMVILGMAMAGMCIGCGGGSGGSGNNPPANSGTTTGNYSVTVTATSGTMTSSVSIPLAVQ